MEAEPCDELYLGFGEAPFPEEEVPKNAAVLLESVSSRHPEWRCFGTREFLPGDGDGNKRGLYEWITYREAYCYTACMSEALTLLGLGKGNTVVIMSANRMEWLVVDIALNSIGAVTVPIYDAQSDGDIVHVVNHSGATAVFLSPVKLQKLVLLVDKMPNVRHIIAFDDVLDDRALLRVHAASLGCQLPAYTVFRPHTNASMDESDRKYGIYRPLVHEIVEAYTENAPRAAATDNDCYRYDPPEYVKPNPAYKGNAEELSYITDTFHGLINKGFEALGSNKAGLKLKTDGAGPDDPFLIQYTSGTVGKPKGVVLTTRSIMWAGKVYTNRLLPHYLEGKWQLINLSYLPNAHIFQHVVCYTMIMIASGTAFFQNYTPLLMDDASVAQPHLFLAVPYILNKLVNSVLTNVEVSSSITKLVFYGIYNVIRRSVLNYEQPNPWQQFIAKNVFKKIRYILGGRVETIASGGAPLSSKTEEFVRVVLGCKLVEGYGSSETSAIGNCQMFDDMTSCNLGHPVPGMELKLVSVPELEYFVTDRPHPRGEILYRGPGILQKYLKDDERTSEVLTEDGWFKTGDVGEILESGALQIIDRKGNIFKLAMGEYIASSDIESVIARSKYISQCIIYGTRYVNYILAIVNIDREAVIEALTPDDHVNHPADVPDNIGSSSSSSSSSNNNNNNNNNNNTSHACIDHSGGENLSDAPLSVLCSNPRVLQLVHESVINQMHAENRKPYEIPRAVIIDPDYWSTENDLATPSMKLKSNKIKQRHMTKIKYIYRKLDALCLWRPDPSAAAEIVASTFSDDFERQAVSMEEDAQPNGFTRPKCKPFAREARK